MTAHGLRVRPAPSVLEQVTAADGIIAVTPIFSASYSGLFKSFVDILDKDALVGRPVLVGATGGTGRHSLALEYAMRPLFAYLRADVVPTGRLRGHRRLGDRGRRRREPAARPHPQGRARVRRDDRRPAAVRARGAVRRGPVVRAAARRKLITVLHLAGQDRQDAGHVLAELRHVVAQELVRGLHEHLPVVGEHGRAPGDVGLGSVICRALRS